MLEQIGNALTFYAFFGASKVGKTGLTVTVNVRRGTTSVVSGGSATEIGDGLYYYTLSSGSVTSENEYSAVFKTSDTTVDQKDIPALWVVGKAGIEDLDAAVSTAVSAGGDMWATDLVGGGYTGDQAGKVLSDTRAKALLISAENVSFTTPTNPITGDLQIVRGDDYTSATGRALPEWSSDDWTPFSLTTAQSVSFKARARYGDSVFEQAATVISDTQVQVAFTAAQTDDLLAGGGVYGFDLEAVLVGGEVVTLARGKMSVIEDVR